MQPNQKTADSWGPWRLPVLEIDGDLYFVDLRLRELRAVNNPDKRINLRTPAGQAVVAAWKAIECRTCGQLGVVRRDDPVEVVDCPRCGNIVVVQGGTPLM